MLSSIPKGGITFNTYVVDAETVAVSYFCVHEEVHKRRSGVGSALFQAWEATIPDQFTTIILRSITPVSTAFWTSMGFEVTSWGQDDHTDCWMKKSR